MRSRLKNEIFGAFEDIFFLFARARLSVGLRSRARLRVILGEKRK